MRVTDQSDVDYRRHELKKVGKLTDDDVVRIKVLGPAGETRWLSINREEFAELIINLLTTTDERN